MTNKPRLVYWDSCVFLSYINGPADRLQVIETLWDEITESNGVIYTSVAAITEVAYASLERDQWQTDQEIGNKIESIWEDASVMIIEYHSEIARIARGLMRSALPNQWVLKPIDAVHLATASWVNNAVQSISEFQTYDEVLKRYGPMIGIPICEPNVIQGRLPNLFNP
jgi:predicted nucleic acid-binding protein